MLTLCTDSSLHTEHMPLPRQPCRCKSSADRHVVGVRAEISPFPSLVRKKTPWISFKILLMFISNSLICTKLLLCFEIKPKVSMKSCGCGLFFRKVAQNSLGCGSDQWRAFRDFLYLIYSFLLSIQVFSWCSYRLLLKMCTNTEEAQICSKVTSKQKVKRSKFRASIFADRITQK